MMRHDVDTEPFALRRPYLFVLSLLGIQLLVGAVAGAVVSFAQLGMFVYWSSTTIALSLIGAALLTHLGWWRKVGFRRSERPALHFLLWIPLCPILVWNVSQIDVTSLVSPLRMTGLLALTLVAAFFEEVFFRGLTLRALAPKGVWKAALATAFLFSLMHLSGALAGSDPGMVAGRLAYSAAIGFAYAAYALHTGLIWPLILVHALANFAELIDQEMIFETSASGETDLIRWLIYVVVFAVYGTWMLIRCPAPDRD